MLLLKLKYHINDYNSRKSSASGTIKILKRKIPKLINDQFTICNAENVQFTRKLQKLGAIRSSYQLISKLIKSPTLSQISV